MANNFNDVQTTITSNVLTDVYTATNKTLVVSGTIANTTTTAVNITIKKMDATTSTSFTIIDEAPLVTNSAFKVPKIVLQTSDKIQVQSDNASGLIDVNLQSDEDIAKLAREHNDANVLCIPARFVSVIEARKILLTFLNTKFEGGRHERRIKKISIK